MKFFLKQSTLFFMIPLFIACGGDATQSVTPSLNFQTKSSTINNEKNKISIEFKIINNYGTDVEVDLSSLEVIAMPCYVDSQKFSENKVKLDEKNKEKELSVVLQFSEECNESLAYQFKANALLTLKGKSNNSLFSSEIQYITPVEDEVVDPTPEVTVEPQITVEPEVITVDTNETTETNSSVDTINYAIKFSLEDQASMKFNLEDKQSYNLSLVDKDTSKVIDKNKVTKITVTSKQENLLKLFDQDKFSTLSAQLVYEKENNLNIYVQSFTRSGLADIDVEIEYINAKGSSETIRKTYSTLVLSGPPTAFSINTAGVIYNFDTKWFENKFLISAVDRYNNIVNISPTIYVSAMTGFTRDSNGKEVLYGNFGNVKGQLLVDADTETVSFEANDTVFDNIDVNRDYLYVFGNVNAYEALGKWDIDIYNNTANRLALSEIFNGENHSNLGFALGHNYLSDPGSSESAEWQVKIDSTDGKYQLDEEGKAFVTLKFPTYLIGKRAALAINFLGKTPETGKILRSGEVKFKTLRSFQGIVSPDPITIAANTAGTVTASRVFYIDTGTGDSWVVKNSHVSCITETTNVNVVGFRENTIVNTVEEFIANGNSYHAFHELSLELIDPTQAGSYSFKECQVRTLPLF